LDTIFLAKDSLTRLDRKKNSRRLRSEIGTQLQQEIPGMIAVQVTVDRDLKNAVATQSSNAGVIGAGLGGAIGGAIGGAVQANREKVRSQEFQAYSEDVGKLFDNVKKDAERFGWTATIE
jgi:hypothetical protein